MLNGIGIFVWNLSCDSIDNIIARCKQYGISWIAVKASDGASRLDQWSSANAQAITQKCKAAGLKIGVWSYCRPATVAQEIPLLTQICSEGIDMLILDAEIEYQNDPNRRQAATQLMQGLRANLGNDFYIAYSTFPIINYHRPFPYEVFNEYCQSFMGQLYWTEMAMTYNVASELYDQSLQNFNATSGSPAKQSLPTGPSYGFGYPGVKGILNKDDIVSFYNHYSHGGQNAISFYSYDASLKFPQFWEALAQIKAANTPPPQNNPFLPPNTEINASSGAVSASDNVSLKQSIIQMVLDFLKSLFKLK